jgi:hypothetical protein
VSTAAFWLKSFIVEMRTDGRWQRGRRGSAARSLGQLASMEDGVMKGEDAHDGRVQAGGRRVFRREGRGGDLPKSWWAEGRRKD